MLDRKKGEPEEMSNHEAILQAFEACHYLVTWREVDPGEACVPVQRGRVHYLGINRKLLPEGSGKSLVSELSSLWETLTTEAAKCLPKYRLDDFLYGAAEDPSLLDVPSLKFATENARKDWRFNLPIDETSPKEGPPKKRKAATLQWPALHQEMLKKYGATWLYFCHVRTWLYFFRQ